MAHLRLFASLREAAGVDGDDIDAETLGALLQEAKARYGAEFSRLLVHASVALNGVPANQLVAKQTRLVDTDEVALLPPVSGGAN